MADTDSQNTISCPATLTADQLVRLDASSKAGGDWATLLSDGGIQERAFVLPIVHRLPGQERMNQFRLVTKVHDDRTPSCGSEEDDAPCAANSVCIAGRCVCNGPNWVKNLTSPPAADDAICGVLHSAVMTCVYNPLYNNTSQEEDDVGFLVAVICGGILFVIGVYLMGRQFLHWREQTRYRRQLNLLFARIVRATKRLQARLQGEGEGKSVFQRKQGSTFVIVVATISAPSIIISIFNHCTAIIQQKAQ